MVHDDELRQILNRADAFVTYVPVRDEVQIAPLLSPLTGRVVYEIKPDPQLDPLNECTQAITAAGDQTIIVLVPGRRFDAAGTRHGKGVGWYDRFLAACPPGWVRIGLCTDKEFSTEPLVRESWDEPMDYVVVQTGDDFTLYTTQART